MNRWIALDCCEGRRLSPNVFFGDTYGTEILRGINFAANIHSTIMSWISIAPNAKLAIELDGGGHNYRTGQIRDRTRSEFLARHGVVVLRFWNHQIRQELDSVLRAIWFALEERQQNNPSPSSSPFVKGRGDF
jgi:very-short-patch-repair endonuclease